MENTSEPDRPSDKPQTPAVLFDLDGTLVDSAYAHVSAWSDALRAENIYLPHWTIHRRIGMSGGLLLRVLAREMKRPLGPSVIERLEKRHTTAFRKMIGNIEILPGARELLKHLSRTGIPWAIATTGKREENATFLKRLGVPPSAPVVTGQDVEHTKPAPDIFMGAAQRLGRPVSECVVVGDSTWDLLAAVRKKGLGVGLLSGGYGREELSAAGAYRVYRDPADLLMHLEDLGIAENS